MLTYKHYPPSLSPHSIIVEKHLSKIELPLLHALEARPCSGAYNVLGALYARSHNLPCAIASVKKALTLQVNAWPTHYNLALALLSNNELGRVANEVELRPLILTPMPVTPSPFPSSLSSGRDLEAGVDWTVSSKFRPEVSLTFAVGKVR